MVNSFNQLHLQALIAAMPQDVLVKRSHAYHKAVVIGRPNQAGAVMISQESEESHNGTFPWFASFFPDHQPKQVADGEVDMLMAVSNHFDTWEKMVIAVRELAEAGFKDNGKW